MINLKIVKIVKIVIFGTNQFLSFFNYPDFPNILKLIIKSGFFEDLKWASAVIPPKETSLIVLIPAKNMLLRNQIDPTK